MTPDQNHQPKITIKKRKGQNKCFDEKLGKKSSLRMMLVPGGTFTMGSPEDALGRDSEDSPQYIVTVSRFFVGRFPVTQAQYEFVMDENPSRFKGANRPVEQVSYYDAEKFCKKLSKLVGRSYQLPSDVQWEYACRAGTTTPFHFGETITTDIANYRGTDLKTGGTTPLRNYSAGQKGKYRQETTPVGYFDVANAFGLFDMHGNVWEWCQDVWRDDFQVVRGGSWNSSPLHCRSASRSYSYPQTGNYFTGFRVVCIVP